MDPLTQGLLGAGLAQSFARKSKVRLAAICGALGGMAPDLDVAIRSNSDPLLAIEFHRHFTHSLAFIPIGGLIVGLVLWLVFFKDTERFRSVYIYTTIGLATHGLLDACTSYGTRLLWPFSDERIAWSVVSIIDFAVTIPLLFFVIVSAVRKSQGWAVFVMYVFILYLSYGYTKHVQVENIVREIAESRGQVADKILLNPTIGNNILWRSIYEYDGNYYVDAIRVGVMSEPRYREGAKVPVMTTDKLFEQIGEDSVLADDVKRFSYFSQGYIYMHPAYENVIADLRYGTLPFDIRSMWGIEIIQAAPNDHAEWKVMRDFTESDYENFWHMLIEPENPGFVPIPK